MVDTDLDGIFDGREVQLQLNPLADDTDQDGLIDFLEVGLTNCFGVGPFNINFAFFHTLANNWDTDNDGLSDGDEVMVHKTSPSQADTDEDGVNDGDEIKQGTNPRVRNDRPTER